MTEHLGHRSIKTFVGFESRGLAGALDLFATRNARPRTAPKEEKLSWVDLPQFTAMHRWDQPADVYDLVSIIDQMVRYHQDLMPGNQPDSDPARTTAAVSSLRADMSKLHELLATEVRTRRLGLTELRQQLATEVRTSRMVVVDPNGFERVVAETSANYGAVSVSSPQACTWP